MLGTFDPMLSTYEPLNYDEIWERRNDLGGIELISATMAWPPIMLQGLETGFMIDLMDVIGRDGNFTVRNIEPDDGRWGSPSSESSRGNIPIYSDQEH